MKLVEGGHHLTFLSEDLDRLTAVKTMWIMGLHDPDGRPDVPDEQTLERADWRTVELG